MEIKIDDKTKLNVHSDHYAIVKRHKNKDKFIWGEDRWFTNLDRLIEYLIRRNLSKQDVVVSLGEFLELYKKEREKIITLLEEGGISSR